MDNSPGLKLFADDASQVQLPSSNINIDSSLQETGLKDAIEGETVDRLVIPKDSVIDHLNFVFDFSGIDTITVFQKQALKSLITPDGTISLYLYRPNGMARIGKGDKYSLERIIPLVRKYIFADEINVYKNYEVGKRAVKVVSGDITQMRLNL